MRVIVPMVAIFFLGATGFFSFPYLNDVFKNSPEQKIKTRPQIKKISRPPLLINVVYKQAETGKQAPDNVHSTPRKTKLKNNLNTVHLPSLRSALTYLSKQRSSTKTRQIIIQLPPGKIRISDALSLKDFAGLSFTQPLIIRGDKKGKTVISGARVLKNKKAFWHLPKRLRRRIPKSVKGKVHVYKLPEKFGDIKTVDVERFHPLLAAPVPFELSTLGKYLRPARWPNTDWTTLDKISNSKQFTLSKNVERSLRWEPDLWMAGYPRYDWSFESLRVKGQRRSRAQFEAITKPRYGLKTGGRVYFYHALSELDEAGEFYYDKRSRFLILLPLNNSPVEISRANNLFVLQNTSNIRFEQLVFENARGTGIRVIGGQNNLFYKCKISNTAGRGISFEGGSYSGIRQSTIESTGEGGVLLIGGDRKSLTPAKLFAENNKIQKYSRLGKTYKPAIELRGVGNLAIGNLITHAPHIAIRFSGNDHQIERNEITRVVLDTSDSGAIYTGRDWTARGTVIKHNFIHDISGRKPFETKGIYLDDMASGVTIEGNIFLNVQQPVFIGGGRDNIIKSNIFVNSAPGVFIDGRGKTWAKDTISNPESSLRKSLAAIPTNSAIWQTKYPELTDILKKQPEEPQNNQLEHNLFIQQDIYLLEPEVALEKQTIRNNFDAHKVTVRGSPHIAEYIEQIKSADDFNSIEQYTFSRNLRSPIPFSVLDREPFVGWSMAR